ncbi:hypothetical protein TNCV_3955301 [Trichonephila clavipes]|nr:hypothetical protein TNCV_3955301 [Trichonephila clavipes]
MCQQPRIGLEILLNVFPSSSPGRQFYTLMVVKSVLMESSHRSLGRPLILLPHRFMFEDLISWPALSQFCFFQRVDEVT